MTEKMDVLEIVLPVLVMIILGMLCRKWKLLDQNGVNNMKTLVTNIMLPVAIFHALATAKIQWKDWNIGADHVHNASDFLAVGFLREIYGRTL